MDRRISILHRGEEIGRLPGYARARRGFALVPEDRRIYPHLIVNENTEMGCHALAPGTEPYSLADINAFFPMLADLGARKGFELGGGQQQVLAVARALYARPECLLLDEPTEGLVPVVVQDIAVQLAVLRRKNGTTLLLTEQNVVFAHACTERLYLLDSGRIVFEGDWAASDAQPDLKQRYPAV